MPDGFENLQVIDPKTDFSVSNSLWSSVQEFIEQTEKKTSKIKISGGAISIGSSLLAITGMISSFTPVSDSKKFDIKPCRKSLQQASYLFHSGELPIF